ncbi:MAG: discoidin domain-containing protein [Verrucomicrobiota bacterium]|jgi:hypothetical protein
MIGRLDRGPGRRVWRARPWLALLAMCGWSFSAGAGELAPLKIQLPAPAFVGTPTSSPGSPQVEKPAPRAAFLAPPDVTNVALGKKVTSGDTNAIADNLAKITDGEKEALENNVVLLRKGPQWVQIDLGGPQEIYAVVIWHAFDRPKVCHGVVVEAADDAEFTRNVRTLFNNDTENQDGLGAGSDREYFETHEGKLVDGKGTRARYVRLYSNGSTEAKYNQYTEVEVYGRPAK